MKKGTFVTYRVGAHTIRAIVRTMHRDGSVTVEARHVLRDGRVSGCYLGYRYRMALVDLTVEQ